MQCEFRKVTEKIVYILVARFLCYSLVFKMVGLSKQDLGKIFERARTNLLLTQIKRYKKYIFLVSYLYTGLATYSDDQTRVHTK